MPEGALKAAAVILKAAGYDGDIPPAAAAVAHKFKAERRGLLALGGHALSPVKADGVTRGGIFIT